MFGIPEYEVTRSEEQGDQLNVFASIRVPPEPCCSMSDLVSNGSKVLLIRDVSIGGKMVGVSVKRQRYKCRKCGGTRYQPMPHVSDVHNMTNRMVERIEKESAARTFASVADELGISEASVRQVFNRYIDRQLSDLNIKTPERMGLDEVFVGRKCRALVTNLSERTIVNLLEDRCGPTITSYFAGLANRKQVEIVAMDLWDPYRKAVRANLPNAMVVVDRFHVMALCISALESVRKSVRASVPRHQASSLAGDRKLLLSNAESLSPDQKESLMRIFRHHPVLAAAYAAKEEFRSIWMAAHREEGAERYVAWKGRLHPKIAGTFATLAWEFERWKEEILAFIETGVTNAYTESLNNSVRILTRIGRGYSFEILRARLLLSHSIRKRTARRFIRNSAPAPSHGFTTAMFARIGHSGTGTEIPGADYGIDMSQLDIFSTEMGHSDDLRISGLMGTSRTPGDTGQQLPLF